MQQLEKQQQKKIDLLICCGDFQVAQNSSFSQPMQMISPSLNYQSDLMLHMAKSTLMTAKLFKQRTLVHIYDCQPLEQAVKCPGSQEQG